MNEGLLESELDVYSPAGAAALWELLQLIPLAAESYDSHDFCGLTCPPDGLPDVVPSKRISGKCGIGFGSSIRASSVLRGLRE